MDLKKRQDDAAMPWYTHLVDKIIKTSEESQDSGDFWQEEGTRGWDPAHGGSPRWLFLRCGELHVM